MNTYYVLTIRMAGLAAIIATITSVNLTHGAEIKWRQLSSKNGDLPAPNAGKEQTSSIVLDIDKDVTHDFVNTERTMAPSVVWYRRGPTGWTKYVIDDQPLPIEAGSCFMDVDGKGNFKVTNVTTGLDFHESKMADLDGNGTLDILCKPYGHDTPRLDIFLNEGPAPEAKFSGASFPGPLGLEIYSLRHMLATNVTTTLALVKAMGFDEVEVPGFYKQTPITFRALLDQNGLKCTALVAPYERLSADVEGVARDAYLLGAKYVICGWIPHRGDFSAKDCERATADFNKCGEPTDLTLAQVLT